MNLKQLKKYSLVSLLLLSSALNAEDKEGFTLTVHVDLLRNSEGVVQFSLYNKDGSIPDEDFEYYIQQRIETIDKTSSTTTFSNLPAGKYAVNILHDENSNGKIDKGFFLPIEGVGFSNYSTINIVNRPNFGDASFEVTSNTSKDITVIYF